MTLAPRLGLLLALGLGAILLAGCAGFPTQPISVSELEQLGRAEARQDRRSGYGHGTGETYEAAFLEARAELTQQLSSRVLHQFRADALHALDDELLRLVGTTNTLARSTLARVEPDRVQRAGDGWYVRIRLPAERFSLLQDEATRQAPALFWYGRVFNTPSERPGLRLKHALSGLNVAHARRIADDTLYHEGEILTFAGFFEQQIDASVSAMRLIPLVEGDRVRLLAIDRESLTPQPNLALRVLHRPLETDAHGRSPAIPLADLPGQLPLSIVGDHATLAELESQGRRIFSRALLHTPDLDTRDWGSATTTRVLVHTVPPRGLAEVDRASTTTPGELIHPADSEAVLRLTAPEGYRDRLLTLALPAGAPFHHVSVPLMEQRYGDVNLSVEGRHGRLRLEGDDARRETLGPLLRTRVPAGEYRVTAFHTDGGRYQRVHDTLTVEADGEVRRDYHAPRDREPYYHGRRVALQLISLAGEPGPDYRLPWGDEGRRTVDDVEAEFSLDHEAIHFDLTFQGQVLFDRFNLLAQGEFGQRTRQYEATNDAGESEQWRLIGHHLAAGAGFWIPLGGSIATITANQHTELVSWSGSQRPAETGGHAVGNQWRYAELSLITPVNVTISVRVPENGIAPHYLIGFGFGQMRRGFELPAEVQAEAVRHYTVPHQPSSRPQYK